MRDIMWRLKSSCSRFADRTLPVQLQVPVPRYWIWFWFFERALSERQLGRRPQRPAPTATCDTSPATSLAHCARQHVA